MRRGEGRQEERKDDLNFNEHGEICVTAFIDRALVTDWDKLNPKVGKLMFVLRTVYLLMTKGSACLGFIYVMESHGYSGSVMPRVFHTGPYIS